MVHVARSPGAREAGALCQTGSYGDAGEEQQALLVSAPEASQDPMFSGS